MIICYLVLSLMSRQKIEEDILDFLEQKLDPDVWQTWQDNGCCTIPLLLLVFAEVFICTFI